MNLLKSNPRPRVSSILAVESGLSRLEHFE